MIIIKRQLLIIMRAFITTTGVNDSFLNEAAAAILMNPSIKSVPRIYAALSRQRIYFGFGMRTPDTLQLIETC